jgi:hypothetical protein
MALTTASEVMQGKRIAGEYIVATIQVVQCVATIWCSLSRSLVYVCICIFAHSSPKTRTLDRVEAVCGAFSRGNVDSGAHLYGAVSLPIHCLAPVAAGAWNCEVAA